MRTLVLVAGVLLVVALAVFLAIGKWKNPFNRRDLPQRLGLDIKQEANGYTFSHALGAHSQYKIHASKVVQLKEGNHVLLHDVQIELYGEDGSRADRIVGSDFEYDPKEGIAKAAGQVEITLMRPGVAPAIAPKAVPGQAQGDKSKDNKLAATVQSASAGEIHVKTSKLIFDQRSGMATTGERVDFTLAQGSGSAVGASYDSQLGLLVLDHAVEINTKRGTEAVQLHAQYADFERDSQLCHLHAATAEFRDGQAVAGDAKILFRPDGSVISLDAAGGVSVTTADGEHLTALTGLLEFNEHNQPQHGLFQGGVTMDSARDARQVHGTSPSAELQFTALGVLKHAHLERGVEMHSEELSETAAASPLRVRRTWRSPVADLEFRDSGHGRLELSTIHGTQGVVIAGESQRGNGAVVPSRLAADDVTGLLGQGSVLTMMTGVGHASVEEASASGTRQTTTGDRLEAHFASGTVTDAAKRGAKSGQSGQGGAAQIQSATVDGHVVLVQEPVAKPGAPPQTMRVTAGRAVYEAVGEWLHLTLSPRVEDGSLQLTAEKIDVSQASGDAFAHGNVKASWVDVGAGAAGMGKNGQSNIARSGQGPAHAISAEAQLHQATGEATFRGQARLWQQANSVAAPVIVLNRVKQTMVARTTDRSDPVRAVLVSAAGPETGKEAAGKSVIRVRGGDLKYSDAERKVVMHGGAAGSVIAETATAKSISDAVELILLPPGNHAGKDGGQAQVDRMTATGHVVVTSQNRRGTGEQLVYTSESGEYVLTGTAATPPKMTDPARGTVAGEALIFHSRDDSVSIEGGGRKTTTETTAPR